MKTQNYHLKNYGIIFVINKIILRKLLFRNYLYPIIAIAIILASMKKLLKYDKKIPVALLKIVIYNFLNVNLNMYWNNID